MQDANWQRERAPVTVSPWITQLRLGVLKASAPLTLAGSCPQEPCQVPLPRTPRAPLLGTRYCLSRSSLLLPSLPQPSLVCLATLSPALATLTRGAALTTRPPSYAAAVRSPFRQQPGRRRTCFESTCKRASVHFLAPVSYSPSFIYSFYVYIFSSFLDLFIDMFGYYINVFMSLCHTSI